MGITARKPGEDDEVTQTDESAQTRPLLTEIDHIAIAVPDLGEAIDYYRETFLKVAESYVQLLTPTRDDSTVAKWLEKKGGPGIHHVGYRVADCAEALDAVKAQGFRVLDEQPRPGSRGTTVAFIHPKDALGTLIELVQE
jgi:methylmalonyl-CoA/ethylmalonyl-CoA epimerase